MAHELRAYPSVSTKVTMSTCGRIAEERSSAGCRRTWTDPVLSARHRVQRATAICDDWSRAHLAECERIGKV